ncbi:MAG: class I SAM-dependent methyltransferase [bacterium]
MEIETTCKENAEQKELQILPPESHPNYRLWCNYAKFARARGEFVADILTSIKLIANLKVLDIGCGEGGTALALAHRGANVVALDFNPKRVQKLKQKVVHYNKHIAVVEGHVEDLRYPNASFDWVILQDVLEHLPNPDRAIKEIRRVLKPGGLVYISTPNRWSPFNFICDPHWNLPFVAILSRKAVNIFITKIVRREVVVRQDFAALLSLFKLRRLFAPENMELKFVNKKIVKQLFIDPTAVVNSDFHLKTVKWLRKKGFIKVFSKLVNNKFGIFNYCINPTWYIIAEKKI